MTSETNEVNPKPGKIRVSGYADPAHGRLAHVWMMLGWMLEEGWTPLARDLAGAFRGYANLYSTQPPPPPPELALYVADLLDKRPTHKTKSKHRGRPKRVMSLTQFHNLLMAARKLETIEFRLSEQGIRGAKEKALTQVAEEYSISSRHLERMRKCFPPPPVSPEDVIEN